MARLRKKHALRALSKRYGQGPGRVQTLLFPKKGFTASTARMWARTHGYSGEWVDETQNYFRVRQVAPSTFRRMRTVPFGASGVFAVLGWNPQKEY